jgi:hypothetical protein
MVNKSYGAHRPDDQQGHRKGNSVYNAVAGEKEILRNTFMRTKCGLCAADS